MIHPPSQIIILERIILIIGMMLINCCWILGIVSMDHTIINHNAVLILMMTHKEICSDSDSWILLYNVSRNSVTLGLRRLVMSHWRYAHRDD